MSFSILIPTLVVINIIYVIAFFAGSLWLGVHQQHYFLGGGKALFTLHIRGVRISVGLYLPVFSRIYIITDGHKERLKYPWEFHGKPLLRRLGATVCAPLALLVTGVVFFILSAFSQEFVIIPRAEVNRLGIYPSATAEIVGFRRGDRILKLNGKVYEDFYELLDPSILISRNAYYTVLRDGREINIDLSALPEGYTPHIIEPFISLLAPFTIHEVAPNTPAAEAGLEHGDKITHVNGEPVIKFEELLDVINSDTTGSVVITVERTLNGSVRTFTASLTADSMLPGRNRIGILPAEVYATETRRYAFADAISVGISRAMHFPVLYIRAVARVIDKTQLSAPIGIVKQASPTNFCWAIGLLSIFVTYANFLPLPRSAFWELIALGYEAICKKQLPYNIFNILRKLALVLAITCIALISLLDIIRLFLRV